ncbi:MAG: 2-hydroxyacid dehydrogenase [Patescibacteria group bacterium]
MKNKYLPKFKKILLFGLNKENLGQEEVKKLGNLCKQKIFLEKDSPKLFGELNDTDCLLVNQGMTVDKKMINNAPNLKFIGILATGYNRIDTVYAKSKGIVVCNIPGYATESVAEFVFGLILEHLRNLEKAKQISDFGDFSGNGFNASEIKNKEFGVVGLGRIGSRVAEIALAFGARVSYWSRNRKKNIEKKGINYKPIDTLIKKSDFLSLHLSITKETVEILNKKRINLIKKGTIVVNVAPMELINLSGLINRLKKGDMTFIFDHPDEMEKKDVEKLSRNRNCIAYPPIGFITNEASAFKKEIFVSNISNFLEGRPSNKVS